MPESVPTPSLPSNFIRQIVEEDLRSGRCQQVVTRFPPEPNGYLHIGHAKAISVGFGLAQDYGGRCHLRMDDTNPLTENEDYVEGLKRDIRWLGYDWGEHFYRASDYFGQLFEWAKLLVTNGHAYVDEQTDEQIRANRGTVDTPGAPSPWRDRPAAESLALLDKMAAGAFPDGAMVLRAKIDMGHPNMKMRDPLMYRIRNAPHHNTGDKWHVYPLYDWAHGQSDAIEGITHSTCSLEFDVNRELYDWYLAHLPIPNPPRQYEFARLAIPYTVMSKRWMLALVTEGHVDGWDDPRMPTIAGLRRRGVTASAIRAFVEGVGVAKANSVVDPVLLDNAIRDELNLVAPRRLGVLDPVEVVISGADAVCGPDGSVDLDAPSFPADVPGQSGSRPVPFTPRVLIEREDFSVRPPPGYKRLAPGRSVRLRHGWVITCVGHEQDLDGNVTRIQCELEPDSRGTQPKVKVWATLHWVSADRSVPVEVRLFDPLFTAPEPGKDHDFRLDLDPASRRVVTARVEPDVATLAPGSRIQLERIGYFYVEPEASAPGKPVLNRIVALKDGWARAQAASEEAPTEKMPIPAPRAKTVRVLGPAGDALVAAGLSPDQAAVLEGDPALTAWYREALAVCPSAQLVAGWVVTELPRVAKERGGLAKLAFDGAALGRLVALIAAGTLTGPAAKQVLQVLADEGGDPERIVAERGLAATVDAAALDDVVDAVIAAFPDRADAYRGGRTGLIGFFVGQVMTRTEGRCDPVAARAALERRLGG